MKDFYLKDIGIKSTSHSLPLAKKGVSEEWHFHLLLNSQDFTDIELDIAVLKTIWELNLLTYCIQLDKIEDGVAKVKCYTIKEIKVTDYNHFDSDRIILSHDLFNLDVK